MTYQLSDFPSLKEVEEKIHVLSETRYNLYRELDSMNRSGMRILYASPEEAYLNDPMVRKIHALGDELSELWKIARMRCAGGGRFVTTRR